MYFYRGKDHLHNDSLEFGLVRSAKTNHNDCKVQPRDEWTSLPTSEHVTFSCHFAVSRGGRRKKLGMRKSVMNQNKQKGHSHGAVLA